MRNIYALIQSVASFGGSNLALKVYKDFDETGDADTPTAWIAVIQYVDGYTSVDLEGIELYAEVDGEKDVPESALTMLDALCAQVLESRNARMCWPRSCLPKG